MLGLTAWLNEDEMAHSSILLARPGAQREGRPDDAVHKMRGQRAQQARARVNGAREGDRSAGSR